MNASSLGAVETLRCLARVAEIFKDLARWLRQIGGVECVTQPCSLTTLERHEGDVVKYGRGNGVGIEWFADAEFCNGAALSFGLEVSWDSGEWLVVPGIRIIHREGEDDLVDVAQRHAVDDADMCVSLLAAARQLSSLRDEALRQFSSRSG